ncbi:MAG: SDR family NAD(P)-dependent oxidoreductase [Novosphingobium sp.]|uniref:SDR family NAD(P)-dependent oxidoreductase n=1 Tax=Novosphingobium sp. TaxID=1874826 RepID=UPI003B9C8218
MCAPSASRSRGAIVNISSTAARFPTPQLAAHSARKGAIEGFSRSLSAELAPRVRVNATVIRTLPLQLLAEVDEIAEAVLFLVSPRAAVITGQVLYANCGGHMA